MQALKSMAQETIIFKYFLMPETILKIATEQKITFSVFILIEHSPERNVSNRFSRVLTLFRNISTLPKLSSFVCFAVAHQENCD